MRFSIFISMVLLSVSAHASKYCLPNVQFETAPQTNKTEYKLPNDAVLRITQLLSSKVVNGAQIASNVICQRLEGINYTGSKDEWTQFINTNIQQLVKTDHKNIQFTLVGSDDSIYKGKRESIEFRFSSTIDNQAQVIVNLAMLDKEKNLLATFSVSGNKKVEEDIDKEFKRLVESFID